MRAWEIAGWVVEVHDWMVAIGGFSLALVIFVLCMIAHRWDQH